MNIKQNGAAFTLIEVMIAVVILSIVSVVFFAAVDQVNKLSSRNWLKINAHSLLEDEAEYLKYKMTDGVMIDSSYSVDFKNNIFDVEKDVETIEINELKFFSIKLTMRFNGKELEHYRVLHRKYNEE